MSGPRFVRFLRAQAADPGGLRDRWIAGHDEVVAAAEGWVATTAGLTPAGHWLAAIAYTSAEAAAAAADAPAPREWWAGVQACLAGPVAVEESADVHLWVPPERAGRGPSGFVQFMRASVRDRARFEEIEEAIGERFAALRPDFLGGLRAWSGPERAGEPRRVTVLDWFASEAEARAGEAVPLPEEVRDLFAAWMALLDGVEWYDVPEPWGPGPWPT